MNMVMNDFTIDFTFRGAAYKGLVMPAIDNDHNGYAVKLESQNQETFLNILAIPCGEGKTDWCFKEEDRQKVFGENAIPFYNL